MELEQIIGLVGLALDVVGVVVIVVGVVIAGVRYAMRYPATDALESYRSLRQTIGRAVLLGLELLVAGDIVRTVAIEPTFGSLGILAGIVLIRTFLSWSLEVELEGRWPWQPRRERRDAG